MEPIISIFSLVIWKFIFSITIHFHFFFYLPIYHHISLDHIDKFFFSFCFQGFDDGNQEFLKKFHSQIPCAIYKIHFHLKSCAQTVKIPISCWRTGKFFFLWLLQQNHYIAYLYRYLKSCCCWNIIKQTFFFCFCSDDPGSVNRNQNEYTAFSIHIIHYITEWFFTAENNLSWLVNQFEL